MVAVSGKWLVGVINGTKKPIVTAVVMKELAGKIVTLLYENKERQTLSRTEKIDHEGKKKLAIPAMGGMIIAE